MDDNNITSTTPTDSDGNLEQQYQNIFDYPIYDIESFSSLLKETILSIRNTEIEALEMFNIIKGKIQNAPEDLKADFMMMLGEQAKNFLELASQQPEARVKALQVAANLVKSNNIAIQINNNNIPDTNNNIADKLQKIDPLAESYKIKTDDLKLLNSSDDNN